MKTLANWDFCKKKLDTRFDTHCIKTGVQLWWSVRNHGRTLRRIRNLRVKVVIDLIEHNVVDFYRLSAAVEHQSELVIVEIDLVQEDVYNGAAVKRIIEVTLLEQGQEVRNLLCGNDTLFLGFNGQLRLQFGFFFLPFG